jgi:hypothetical protein
LWTENFDEFRLGLETAVEVGDHVLALESVGLAEFP